MKSIDVQRCPVLRNTDLTLEYADVPIFMCPHNYS